MTFSEILFLVINVLITAFVLGYAVVIGRENKKLIKSASTSLQKQTLIFEYVLMVIFVLLMLYVIWF